jgi:hypothetical protein
MTSISYAPIDNQPFSGVEKGWALAWHLDLGVRYVLFLRRIGINVLAAFGVELNVHGAAVHDLYLIEVKLRMTHQIVFDDLFEVFPINLDLVFYKAFILVIFHRIDIAHGSLHSRTT